jgi:hypothetical protein
VSTVEIVLVTLDVFQIIVLVATFVLVNRPVDAAPGKPAPAGARRRPTAPDRFEVVRLSPGGEHVLATWRGDAAGAARRVIRERTAGHRWILKVDGKVARTSDDEPSREEVQ